MVNRIYFTVLCVFNVKFCSQRWRPSFWCMPLSERVSLQCGTLERVSCHTSRMSRLHYLQHPSPPPLPHPWTPFSPESPPLCTFHPTFPQTPRSFYGLLVSSVCMPQHPQNCFSVFSVIRLLILHLNENIQIFYQDENPL